MTGLAVKYLGLDLRSPLVASASPLTGRLDDLMRLQDAGIGAVVLPSLFEEQLDQESLELSRFIDTGSESFAEASGLFPDLHDYNAGPNSYLNLVEKARYALDVPVIASLNGATDGGWVRYARYLEDAGASAIELNTYLIAADEEVGSQQLESRYLELVRSVRDAIDIPLAVKLSPFFTALANMAWRIVEAGADGLVLFNRFYQPDLDLDRMEVTQSLVLSNSDELRLPLRWIGILYDRIPVSLAATTGVHTAADALKVVLAGGSVAMMTSALLKHGPEHVTEVETQMRAWLESNGYESLTQMRGSMSQHAVGDPAAFERANYMQTITRYSTPHR